MENQLTTTFLALRRAYIEKCFGRLNDRQREAVFYGTGPLLLLAGAGSGKTTVLVNRIANLIRFGDAYESDEIYGTPTPEDITELQGLLTYADRTPSARMEQLLRVGGLLPYHVLAITFTNKAAGELKSRLSSMLGQAGQDVNASTFHSACVRILRRSGELLGYPKSFTIYDTDDAQRAMKEVYKALNVDDKFLPVKSALSSIGRLKDQMVSPEDAATESRGDIRTQLVGKVYAAYQQKLKSAGAMDFDDLIYQTVRLFENFPEELAMYQRKFRYILVDEYQDTSHAQFRLVELLGAAHRNVCVVGDDDQSIYRFRGATIENILNFENQFAGAKVIRLEQNYRSTSNILNAANSVIANNAGRKGKTLWTENGDGDRVIHFVSENETDEAQNVAQIISDHVANGGTLRDCAVLYRMNAQSGPVETYFVRAGLPYKIIGGHKFYDRKEVKDMLAYLSILSNPKDDLRLARIINEPGRKIGGATMDTVAALAADEGVSMLEIVSRAASYPSLSRASKALAGFWSIYESLREAAETLPLEELLGEVAEISGYKAMLEAQGEEGQTRMENIGQLMNAIKVYADAQGAEASLAGFLEETALITDLDNYDENADVVVLMTLHAAKGLEFPLVFIVGMEEGIFPSEMSGFSREDLEEERRLCYVGITRAKKQLWLCSAASRMIFGQTRRNRPSRFLEEIGSAYMEEQESDTRAEMRTARSGWAGYESDSWQPSGYQRQSFGARNFEPNYQPSNYTGGGLRMAANNNINTNTNPAVSHSAADGEFSIRSAYERESRRAGSFDTSTSFASRSSLMNSDTAAKAQPAAKKTSGAKYAVGDSVQHKVFGQGTVLSVTPVGGDMLVEVQFASATKKMMANYAPLTRVE
ncbi:MAG: UvrD-helicase domain-containing protein [Oscillospiraceae bacterium]|nr:UvrD-helicase domain-containing protein [Oscillospiraceae bacterium]